MCVGEPERSPVVRLPSAGTIEAAESECECHVDFDSPVGRVERGTADSELFRDSRGVGLDDDVAGEFRRRAVRTHIVGGEGGRWAEGVSPIDDGGAELLVPGHPGFGEVLCFFWRFAHALGTAVEEHVLGHRLVPLLVAVARGRVVGFGLSEPTHGQLRSNHRESSKGSSKSAWGTAT